MLRDSLPGELEYSENPWENLILLRVTRLVVIPAIFVYVLLVQAQAQAGAVVDAWAVVGRRTVVHYFAAASQ